MTAVAAPNSEKRRLAAVAIHASVRGFLAVGQLSVRKKCWTWLGFFFRSNCPTAKNPRAICVRCKYARFESNFLELFNLRQLNQTTLAQGVKCKGNAVYCESKFEIDQV